MHKFICTIDKSNEENKTEENKGALKTWFTADDYILYHEQAAAAL